MDELEIEIPQYFICPISLQIMKDPVTAVTGITYDRDSIEHWLFQSNNTTCPVTKQPLPPHSDLTPNHTLRRLIQAWCTQNAAHGVDRIPTPKSPLTKFHILKILTRLRHPHLHLKTLRQLELLAAENERNRRCLMEAGVPKAMVKIVSSCFNRARIDDGLEEAVSLLQFVKIPPEEINTLLNENNQILDSLTWILGCEITQNSTAVKSHAVTVLKTIIQNAHPRVLETLKPEFFERIVNILRNGITQQGMNSALKVLLAACSVGRNRKMMVEANAVFELIEIELGTLEKKTTELIFGVLFHLCSSAFGRAELVRHRGGIAVLTERILRISPAVNDSAVSILSVICKSSCASRVVVQEMLTMGTVDKLCMLLQTDHPTYLKEKAMGILKIYSQDWKDSPCFPGRSFDASLKG